jgi:hypothetical protein
MDAIAAGGVRSSRRRWSAHEQRKKMEKMGARSKNEVARIC